MSMSSLMKDPGYKGGEQKKELERKSKVLEDSLWKARHYKKCGGKNEDRCTVALGC